LPVGSCRLRWHASLAVFVEWSAVGRALLLYGIGDGNVVKKHSVALVHGRRVTRCFAVKNGPTQLAIARHDGLLDIHE